MRNALRSSLRAQNGQANFSSPLLFFFASQDMESTASVVLSMFLLRLLPVRFMKMG